MRRRRPTNRLTSGVYDALGNLTSFAGKSYTYDDFSRQKGYTTTGETYVYDANDERVARVPSKQHAVVGDFAGRRQAPLPRSTR